MRPVRLDTLREIRRWEVAQVMAWMNGAVLEVGAGTGTQATVIAESHPVFALEIASDDPTWKAYQKASEVGLILYDGTRFPFADDSFGTVFTSQVLEHVRDVGGFLGECQRVSPRLVMIVPTATWRWWSILAYYPAQIWRPASSGAATWPGSTPLTARRKVRLSSFFPSTHGEKGNTLTELIWFSRWRWRRDFRLAGLHIVQEKPLRMFYTGEDLTSMSVAARRRIPLGAPTRAFLLERQ